MNITLNGKPVKRANELRVGEHGFCLTVACGGILPSPAQRLYSDILPPMGDCYRVTRVDEETLNVEFVPAAGHQSVAMDEERILIDTSSVEFAQRTHDAARRHGWRVDNIIVTADGVGGFSYLALLHREARDE